MSIIPSFFAFDVTLFFEAFVLLFAVLDAFGTAPIFMGLTDGYPQDRKSIVRNAVIIATAILAISFVVTGITDIVSAVK